MHQHRLAGLVDTKIRPIHMLSICCLRPTDTYRFKVKGWEKVFHANVNHKKSRAATLISEKINFKTKMVIRDKGCYIMIKGSIQEDITMINIYGPNTGALLCKANTKKHKGRNRHYHNNSGVL